MDAAVSGMAGSCDGEEGGSHENFQIKSMRTIVTYDILYVNAVV